MCYLNFSYDRSFGGREGWKKNYVYAFNLAVMIWIVHDTTFVTCIWSYGIIFEKAWFIWTMMWYYYQPNWELIKINDDRNNKYGKTRSRFCTLWSNFYDCWDVESEIFGSTDMLQLNLRLQLSLQGFYWFVPHLELLL